MTLLKDDLDEDTLTGGRDFSLLGGDNLFRPDEDTNIRTDQRGRQDQRTDQATDSMLDFGSGLGGFDFAPPRPVTTKPSLFEDEPRPVRAGTTTEDAFDVYGLQDATDKSQAKWIKLNKKPLTDDSALDVGAWAVDNSISARFKVKKTTGKPTSLDDSPIGNYWEMNKGKFRDYKVKRGNKFSLMDEYIEKSSSRLDTSSEVDDITLAKLMKSKGGSLFKKPRRTRGFSLW